MVIHPPKCLLSRDMIAQLHERADDVLYQLMYATCPRYPATSIAGGPMTRCPLDTVAET